MQRHKIEMQNVFFIFKSIHYSKNSSLKKKWTYFCCVSFFLFYFIFFIISCLVWVLFNFSSVISYVLFPDSLQLCLTGVFALPQSHCLPFFIVRSSIIIQWFQSVQFSLFCSALCVCVFLRLLDFFKDSVSTRIKSDLLFIQVATKVCTGSHHRVCVTSVGLWPSLLCCPATFAGAKHQTSY